MFDYKHVFGERGHLYNRASQEFPSARANERKLLIDRLDLKPNLKVCDAPAGGGYVAEGIASLDSSIQVICVEPAERFAAGINPRFQRIIAPIEDIPLADSSVDRVASLAGLHHLTSKTAFYREAFRILTPGGQFAVADVQDGSGPALFLNGPCHEFSETGHEGQFVQAGELTRDLRVCGFKKAAEEHITFTWDFPNQDAMVHFCKGLFGLVKADENRVLEEIRRYLTFSVDAAGARLNWQLVYAVATRY